MEKKCTTINQNYLVSFLNMDWNGRGMVKGKGERELKGR